MERVRRIDSWIELTMIAALLSVSAFAAQTRVIVISVDGLRADMVDASTAPNMAALSAAGAHAARAINDLPSMTLPNHATMLTGLVSDRHGLILNFDIPGKIPQKTLFEYAKAAGLRGGFYATKSKLSFLAKPESLEVIEINGIPRDVVDRMLPEISPDGLDVFFLHIRSPDSTGHRAGWMSPEYFDAVAEADTLIGSVVKAAQADKTRDTYIIVTADHGGSGMNHFVNNKFNRTIPWIANGPGITAGKVIDGTVTVADTMPTALWLLNVPVPSGLSGRAIKSLLDDNAAKNGAQLPVVPVGIPCTLFAVPGLVAFMYVYKRATPTST